MGLDGSDVRRGTARPAAREQCRLDLVQERLGIQSQREVGDPQHGVADGIDAAVEPVEPPARDPPADRIVVKAQFV